MSGPGRRAFLLHGAWIQAALLVFAIGFFVLGLLAYRTYEGQPPIPDRVVDPSGETVFTADDVLVGQRLFYHSGLMQYGSIFGHGAYLGPDFTADYLHRAAAFVSDLRGGVGAPGAAERTIEVFKTNRYDPASGELTYTDDQAAAFDHLVDHYAEFFGEPTTKHGLRPKIIADPEDIRALTAFFSWSAWTASTLRPGLDYTYTNNWPPEVLVDNRPSANVVVWSVLSLIALLGGIGLLLAAFGRWDFLGWHGAQGRTVSFRPPGEVSLTPAQVATAWFFFVTAALFVVQTLVGGASQHYRAELTGFFGLDLARFVPYNLARTMHVQLALFWVATSYLATGIFLAPMIARREPKGQAWLAYGLLGALVVVVVGSITGEALSIHGYARNSWFGMQGLEYLDLGRLWQVLLTAGLAFWAFMIFRVLRTTLREDHPANMPWMFFYATLAIPAFYAVGLLSGTDTHFTAADFWRFWVVHLWVEDFLELFTTISVAYIFVLLGVIRERVALSVIFLDILLYSAGGVIGTMHHNYFSGEPAEHMALGAFFSAAEVIPLTFLTLEGWSFLQLGARQHERSARAFPHFWTVMFLVAVGFWNFLGAGVFGFLINLPIVSYYEIGTALTSNHGHAAMMGVYGMLAVGFAVFCLRYMIPEDRWPDRLVKVSFWSLNAGLAWMVFATLFPVGLLQLYASVNDGYFEARSLNFVTGRTSTLIEWARFPGDAVFIAGGAVPFLYLTTLALRYKGRKRTLAEAESALFTEVREAEPAAGEAGH